MQRPPTIVALLGLILASPAARADFVVKEAPVSPNPPAAVSGVVAPGPGVVADRPQFDPGDRQSVPGTRPLVRAGRRIVMGFGDQVPLSFACRQIVPANIRVSYGAGADPGMLVSWTGGDTWPRVLGSAIKPLGLRMISSGAQIEIKD